MKGLTREAGLSAQIDYLDGRPATLHLNKVKLVLEDETGGTREYIFDQDVIQVGSAADNDVVIADSRVSRYHCKIIQEPSGYLVLDLGSTNGTMVNRVQIREGFLKSGSMIGLGGVEILFQIFGERVELTPSVRDSFGNVVGRSRKMREVFSILERIAPTSATVVLEGETGTGKEVAARSLHLQSPRAREPFVVFDCGAVPKDLIESELFGHEKGSFTGASQARQGLFEMAHGGTLFLDEIGELSMELQPKLLRALEQREIRRVGSNRSIKVDARLIAATNRDLEEEVTNGRFREDLFYRLNVVRIVLPSLRERIEDIPLLVRHFLKRAPFNRNPDGEPRIKGVTESAMRILMEYHWPGNVRELLNVIERSTSFADGDLIEEETLPDQLLVHPHSSAVSGDITAPIRLQRGSKTFKEAKEQWLMQFERQYLEQLMAKNPASISAAAREADLDRKYLRKLLRKHEIIERSKEKSDGKAST